MSTASAGSRCLEAGNVLRGLRGTMDRVVSLSLPLHQQPYLFLEFRLLLLHLHHHLLQLPEPLPVHSSWLEILLS